MSKVDPRVESPFCYLFSLDMSIRMPEFVNISAYKFVDLDALEQRKATLLPLCQKLDLRGTILLSSEGINMFLAGTRENIDEYLETIRLQPEFADIQAKESFSDHQPFSRMLVRLKKEIISMGVETIRPRVRTSPKMQAHELKKMLDEGQDLTLLDVRNDYEVEIGTFENAIPAGIDHFRRFPEIAKSLPDEMKEKPLVMFCTGGIRCEKAGPLMEDQGFKQVYQLDGGILKYFEECGGDHYDGDCFVFDKRVAVDPNLEETEYDQCYACQAILSLKEQESPFYVPPKSCPYCFESPEQKLEALLLRRDVTLKQQTSPLPGSTPYCNVRPMNVPLRFDHQPVVDFLSGMHAHLSREYWQQECDAGRIVYKGDSIPSDLEIRAGWRIEHKVPQTIEPDVNNDVHFLYEDESLIAMNKPAPLPMHACGRFNRNSLQHFVDNVFAGEQMRILHRLDANTTGVVLMARKKSVAQPIHVQFKAGTVKKVYFARVEGHPTDDQFSCNAAIGEVPEAVGSRRVDDGGLESLTEFEVIKRFDDQTSLIRCVPKTGRTNQIRLHLSHLGFPIVGDPTYREGEKRQVLSVDEDPMCLHAFSVEIVHPETKTPLKIIAPQPAWCGESDF